MKPRSHRASARGGACRCPSGGFSRSGWNSGHGLNPIARTFALPCPSRVPHPAAGRVPGRGLRRAVLHQREQFAYWQHTHVTVDVAPGRGSGL
ncbi:DUF779 domain-containing protein [Longimicrobium sp.]|uniref:DUF779 domain-containing protein n=1 Tax=Longimicrobium sp. TaxID=2029185 RepID=UPI0039C90967